jgi:hypothetical protein
MPISINGSGTISGISVGGLENGCVNEADLATAAVTNTKLASNAVTIDKMGSAEQSGLCKAWVNFNGTGTVAILASYNVSSITDNGLGRFTINLTNSLVDTNYAWTGCVRGDNDTTSVPRLVYALNTGTKTSSSLAIVSSYGADLADYPEINVAIFR